LCKISCLQSAIEGIGDVTGGNGEDIITRFDILNESLITLSDCIKQLKENLTTPPVSCHCTTFIYKADADEVVTEQTIVDAFNADSASVFPNGAGSDGAVGVSDTNIQSATSLIGTANGCDISLLNTCEYKDCGKDSFSDVPPFSLSSKTGVVIQATLYKCEE